jgi:hypothetical protein
MFSARVLQRRRCDAPSSVRTERLVHAQRHPGAKPGLQARARLARELRDAFDANIMQALDRRRRQPQPFGKKLGKVRGIAIGTRRADPHGLGDIVDPDENQIEPPRADAALFKIARETLAQDADDALQLVLVDPGFGIEEATLTASWIEALTERQTIGAHVTKAGESTDVGELVDRLRVKLGAERVFRVSFVELQLTSHFSFLRGASSAEELFATASLLGIPALGITDRNSLAGIVRAHEAAKVTGVRLIVGCRLDLTDFPSLLVYPTDRAGYGRLCRLLTLGKARAGKGKCTLSFQDVAEWSEGLLAIMVTDKPDARLAQSLGTFRNVFGDRSYCALTRRFRPNDAAILQEIASTATQAGMPTVVTGDVLYHTPERRRLQDVVTCIRLKTTIDKAGFLKERHADRFLKTPAELKRLFRRFPEALARTQEIAARCRFSLDELTYSYPTEALDGLSAQERLEKLTWEGAAQRYPNGILDNVIMQLRHELNLIERMQYAPYFLTVDSIVRFARSKGILCQGRGSAANSTVCFVLGITSIDPVRQGEPELLADIEYRAKSGGAKFAIPFSRACGTICDGFANPANLKVRPRSIARLLGQTSHSRPPG